MSNAETLRVSDADSDVEIVEVLGTPGQRIVIKQEREDIDSMFEPTMSERLEMETFMDLTRGTPRRGRGNSNDSTSPFDAQDAVVIDISHFQPPCPGPILHRRNAVDSRDAIMEVVDLCSPVANRRRARRSLRRVTQPANPSNEAYPPPPPGKPQSSVYKEVLNESSNGDVPKVQCPICLDSALKNAPTTTKCGHVYCNDCIVPWVITHNSCPLCKAKQSARSLVRMYL